MSTPQRKTIIVNLFAGPGAGKTTCAWEIAAELKKTGRVVEYVSEVAKEYVWAERFDMLDGTATHQKQLFEEQNARIQRLIGKVDIIVTDCPVLLYLVYLKEPNLAFEKDVIEKFTSQNNFNIFIRRGKGFETAGRIHNLSQSTKLDEKVIRLLQEHNIFFDSYSHNQIQQCVLSIQLTSLLLYNGGDISSVLAQKVPTPPTACYQQTAATIAKTVFATTPMFKSLDNVHKSIQSRTGDALGRW